MFSGFTCQLTSRAKKDLTFFLLLFFIGTSWSLFAIDLGPLFYLADNNTPVKHSQNRLTFLGPIGEFTWGQDGQTSLQAVRPLWSREVRSDGSVSQDIIWPLSVWRDSWFVKFYWVLLFYSSTSTATGLSNWYFIPIWFSGHNKKRDFFWGFFPLYGEVFDLIGYDRIFWVIWPLFWETDRAGTTGQGYLWPIINWDTGPKSDKLRIFPFYAYNHVFNQQYSESYIWPLFHRIKSMDPKHPGSGWLFWPVIGHNQKDDISSWSFIWPLFQKTSRSPDGSLLHCPWPVFQYSKNLENPGDYLLYIFPLLGRSEELNTTYYFVLWPLVHYLEDRGEDQRIQWLWMLPLYWTKSTWDRQGNRLELYRRFWPFASYYRAKDVTELRIIDLWPQRNMPVIDRNWNPLWTFARYYENGNGNEVEIFWGCYRQYEDKTQGSGFSIFPFYKTKHFLPPSPSEKTGEGKPFLNPTMSIRDIFMGALRVTTKADESQVWRLLWILEL